ncbi:hypothetical protein [Planktothricoides raciborskii]|uniref:Uncharacterized protein n=1 Tax=Planktothricoides raciborskii FACHB-1370 TaxID=2949576 RepID=A0ABR8EJR4_9CYAN|nr:hypothetical protein [Planktothricoides raciborskii]MBD2547129.1 hypothetical protein [Planktothricoides raciborskii FACHB-1370]MBD2585657.1 hypothetical protein [Planktothricoides raciborskii FACHB-1261]
MLSNQTWVLDLITLLWLATVLIMLFFWLPTKSLPKNPEISWSSWVVGCFTRITLVMTTGVLALSALHLFRWVTLVFLYSGYLLGCWLHHHHCRIKKYAELMAKSFSFAIFDALDWEFSWSNFLSGIAIAAQNGMKTLAKKMNSWKIANPQEIILGVFLTGICSFSLLLRFEYPLQQLRFSHPDRYYSLLLTRQLLAGEWPAIDRLNYLPIFSAWAAMLSLISAIDAMQVVRFLSPILGFILVLALGYCVNNLSKNSPAALVAMLTLGAYLFTGDWEIPPELPQWDQQWLSLLTGNLNSSLIHQWAGAELEIAVIFLLLGLGRSSDFYQPTQRKTTLIDTVCCFAIMAIAQPMFVGLALVGLWGLFGRQQFSLIFLCITWLFLGGCAAFPGNEFDFFRSFLLTLPVGLSILCSLLFLLIATCLTYFFGQWSGIFCLILVWALAVNFLLPLPPQIGYFEYEITARKTLELRQQFPFKDLIVIAPPEQLGAIYGAGWYGDLATFVDRYKHQVENPDFTFPVAVKHLLIFVEKLPFVTLTNENQAFPNEVLLDPSYRNYRSLAGRASLQFQAWQMCETYRRHHPETLVYYEDNELIIYHYLMDNLSNNQPKSSIN